jgi:hypothetical protein
MIICDSREQKNAHILRYFERHGIDYQVQKMDTADYMVEGQPNIVVDRKQNLDEICANLTYKGKKANENGGKGIPSNVARFWREVRRSHTDGIKLVVLIEHGENVKSLADVAAWGGSRSGISGRKLVDEMDRLSAAYGVEWQFCGKSETAEKILKILNYKGENYHGQNHN